jgi:hypothetical protein
VHDEGGPSAALWGAYQTWRTAAGPLADFVSVAPFLAPWTPGARAPAHPGAAHLVRRIRQRLAAHGHDPTAVFLEAPPRLGLAVGRLLSMGGWTVIPLFARWPAPRAVLPVEHLAGWLLSGAAEWRERTAAYRHPENPPGAVDATDAVEAAAVAARGSARLCLLLDAERARTVPPATLRRRFDNRYEYGPYTLPPGERLREWGIARVLWPGPAVAPAADLDEYAAALTAASITLDLVSLRSWLR